MSRGLGAPAAADASIERKDSTSMYGKLQTQTAPGIGSHTVAPNPAVKGSILTKTARRDPNVELLDVSAAM